MKMFGVINGKQDYKIKNNEEAVNLTASFTFNKVTILWLWIGISKGNIKIEFFVNVYINTSQYSIKYARILVY